MNNNINNYKETDCGRIGKALECAITGKDKIGSAGKTDWRHFRKCYEIKTGAGELGDIGGQLCKGSSRVIYVPVPVIEANGDVDLSKQEGFVLSRDAFLQALESAGMLREKTTTAGTRKVTIQTFWNRKLNKPHGKGYDRVINAMYDYCEMTLEEFIESWA